MIAVATSVGIAPAAQAKCIPITRGEPCLAPIQSLYNFSGFGSGATSLLKAKVGPQRIVEYDANEPVWERTISWHAAAHVKIVAAFLEFRTFRTRRFQRIPTGPQSGHRQWRFARASPATPLLILEGERTGSTASIAKTFPCPNTPHEPCRGPIEVSTNYAGYKEGPSRLIKITLGPSHQISQGNERQGGEIREVVQRQASWHSVPNVEIVAVFILHRHNTGQRFRYQQIPSGKHSGHTTLTNVVGFSGSSPVLIIQGRSVKGSSTGHHKPTHCYVTGVPCLGRVQSLYTFDGRASGRRVGYSRTLAPKNRLAPIRKAIAWSRGSTTGTR
jgi:hypothetical protein